MIIYLVLLPEEPLLDGEEACLPHGAGAVERGGRAPAGGTHGGGPAPLALVWGVDGALAAGASAATACGAAIGSAPLAVLLIGDGRRQGHAIVVGDLERRNGEKKEFENIFLFVQSISVKTEP